MIGTRIVVSIRHLTHNQVVAGSSPAGPGIQSFTSKTQYDSCGRILKMTYPDGEQVRYFHSYGGDLFQINGYDLGNTVLTVPSESYVKQLGYDQYGNRTYMEYGNGTKTTFEYNANTLR